MVIFKAGFKTDKGQGTRQGSQIRRQMCPSHYAKIQIYEQGKIGL